MRGLSISTAWEETKAILARDGKLFAAVALALIVLPQVVLAVVGTPIGPEANALSRIVYVAALLLGLVSQIAFNRLAMGHRSPWPRRFRRVSFACCRCS